MSKPPEDTSSASWDTYWRGTSQGQSLVSSGASLPEITEFWSSLFAQYSNHREPLDMIDIASGHGAVLEVALSKLTPEQLNITCVDNSASALKNIKQRFPTIEPCNSDAARLPLEDGQFDLVTSQFGAEYAGQKGLHEAARMVKPGGTLAMILHLNGSGIYRECQISADAVKRMVSVDFIGLADKFLNSAFVNVHGGNPANYAASKKALLPALTEMKAILAEYGQHVAGDTIHKLFTDVSDIHRRIQNFDRKEVRSWLRQMDAEMGPYIERMESMCAAALDEQEFSRLVEWLTTQGFKMGQAAKLSLVNSPAAVAWVLSAHRSN